MSESDSSVGSVEDPNPPKQAKGARKKNEKVEKKKRPAPESDDESAEKHSSSKSGKKPKRQTNSDGDEMIPLGMKKFVTVREFHGKTLIDIREYYEKDGKTLPGKKGISLSRKQFSELKKLLPEIDAKVESI